ncbi:MAG: SMEK domain-containing protein [Coleofasciculus sp. E2-BRE-01]
MSSFVTQVKGATAMTRTDINKVAETLLIPLFSEVYGYTDLQNLNDTEGSNYPGIDLGDERARVAFQITSTSNSEKIKKTLRKFVEYKFYEKYDRLIIYILTEKQQSYFGRGYEEIIQNKFTFDKGKDIWDYRDILKAVANLQVNQVRRIEAILEENFGEERRLTEWEVVDKVEQTISEYTQLFVGREEERQKLARFLQENSSGLFLVTAPAGFGKTALLANWVKEWQHKDCDIAYHFFNEITRSVASGYRNLIRQLDADNEFAYDLSSNNKDDLRKILYNVLRAGRQTEKPLIIVIDGLDEAGETFLPPFPNPLPENVFVIASARAEEGQDQKYLEGWTDNCKPLHLERLSKSAIAQWLREAGNVELAGFADDTSLVSQLDKITDGFPLYLSYLIDDLCHHAPKHIQNIQELLAQTPKSFEAYVQQQIKRLDELDLPDERWQFFALLAVAKGALTKEDIKAVTKMRDRQLRQMHLCWQVTRWIRITAGNSYAFAHPLLGTTFTAHLGDDAEDAWQKLINYCSRWQEHKSYYALRYYPEHLREKKRWEELYAIARNPDFAATQGEQLPNEPDLPLKTVQTALLGAANQDDAGGMAKFLLLHAQRLKQIIAQESPLEALRKGSLQRAWKLADQFEIERCILWYLLLAWELKDEGRLNDARETLEKLQQKDLPRFSTNRNWQDSYATYFLAQVFEVSEDTCTVLAQKLLYNRPYLLTILSNLGKFSVALKIVQGISSEPEQVWELQRIAKAQAEQGDRKAAQATLIQAIKILQHPAINLASCLDFRGTVAQAQIEELEVREAAKTTFAHVLEIANKIPDQDSQLSAFMGIADKQKEAGMFPEALDTLQRIDPMWNLEKSLNAKILRTTAEVEAKIGNADKAKVIFASAVEKALGIQDKDNQVFALYQIVKAQAKVREFADACETAKKIDKRIQGLHNQAKALLYIAWEQADVSKFQDAIETVEKIEPESDQVEALVEILKKQAEVEDFHGAFASASRIEEPRSKAQALKIIAIAQAKAKPFTDDAIKTLEQISNESEQSKALLGIVKAQAEAGNFSAAETNQNRIKDASEQQEALAEIAKAYANAKNFDAALKIAKKIKSQWRRWTIQDSGTEKFDITQRWEETLGKIAQMQVKAGQNEIARSTFATVISEPHKIHEPLFMQAKTILEVAELQVKNDQIKLGLDNIKISRNVRKIIADKMHKSMILALTANTLIKAGNIKEAKAILKNAFEIAQYISNNREDKRTETLTIIAQVQGRADDLDAAFKTLRMLKMPRFATDKAEALRVIAQLQIERDEQQREKWKTILTNAYKSFENAPSFFCDWNKVKVLCTIAVARVEVGDKEAALATLTELYEAAQAQASRERNKNKSTTVILTAQKDLSTIAAAYAEAGEIPMALKITDEIEDELERIIALSEIAWIQFKKGEKGELSITISAALQSKDKIKNEQKQLNALWMIAQIQTMTGQVDKAFHTAEKVLINRNQLLCHIAAILVQLKDKNNFKRLLFSYAYNIETAYQMCGLIARLYPEQAESVAKAITDLN